MDEPLKGLDEPLQRRIVPRILEQVPRLIVTSHSEFETQLWGGTAVDIGAVG